MTLPTAIRAALRRPDAAERHERAYTSLRERFEAALDNPDDSTALPSPGRMHADRSDEQSLAEWWGSNVVEHGPVIALVVKAYRAGDEDAKALVNRLAHEYADFYADFFDFEESADEFHAQD